MIDSELQIYNDQIFSFCKSIVIKSNLMALQAKEALEKFYGVTIEQDSDNPYYRHLCGQYSDYDEPIYIIDEGNKVVLTQELMDAKPWIRKKYDIYGAAFEKLATEYAGRENFIRLLIMRPCASMEELLAMEDFTLIAYDTSILEEQERYSIVEGLKKFIQMFKTRWLIQEYVYEELYGLDLMSRFYCLLPPYFLSVVRVDNIKTQYAHSFHIWNHLSSFGLDDYRSVLTLDQQLFLYKNIEYLVANTGKHGTLAILIKEILSQNYLSIEPQMIINEYSPNITGESVDVTPYVVSRRFDDTPISQFFTTKTTSIEQFYELLYSYGLATKSDYLNHIETAHRLSLMNHTTLQTKFLELKRSLPQRPYIQMVFSMLVGGIIHMIAAQRLSFSITVVEEKLDFSEALTPKVAFAFLLYLINKQYGLTDVKIPTKLKAYPYIRQHSSFIDTNIRTLTGIKKISDFINITEFKTRFDVLDTVNYFNFAEDFCSLSLRYSLLAAEDLRYACENEYGINEAINKLYNQMFIIGNNDVNIFGSADITIKEWLQANAYVVYDFILDIEKDENIEISTILNQLIEGFIPSAVLNSPEFNLNVSDYDKYEKLKQLFIQLCSYNVVFLDPNLKNQITCLHDPINIMNSDLSKIIGISEVKMLSYLPLPYPNPYVSGADPKNTGTLNFSAVTNDPLDYLYEYKLEFSRNSNFSSIDQIIYGKANMSKHHVRVLPEFEDRLLPGIDYYARVSFRSRLFDWEFTEPSEGMLFNSGKIVPPTLNFPQILETTSSVVVKTPTITQLDNSLTPEFKISLYEEETVEVTGASLLLTAEDMTLTFQHADLHIKSRWFAASNSELTNIIHDSGWVDDLYSYQTSWDKTANTNVYFGVKFKGLRFGESEMSNIASFEMRNLKKPVILNVSGEFNPLSTNIFDITSDEFAALGSVVDTHTGSRWLVTIDEACTKVLWDSGWDATHLEEVTTAPFKDLFSDSYKILTPSISQTPTSGEGYGFKISPFDFIPVVSETTPDSVYVTVQYKGAILGYSDRSDPYRVFSTLQPRGHLVVNITPEDVVAAGAQWRRKGTTLWRDPGYKEEYLLEGSYTVEFKPIDRWTKPADLEVTITDTLTTTVSGTYVELPHFGSLKINIIPETAAILDSWWRVVDINGVWCQSGFTINDLEPGTYTVTFMQLLDDFMPKDDIQVTVVSEQLTEITTEYILRGAKVTVNLMPPEAVAAGAQYRFVGETEWRDSGVQYTGITEGTYNIELKDTTGYIIPNVIAPRTFAIGQTYNFDVWYNVLGIPTDVETKFKVVLGSVTAAQKRLPPATVTVNIVDGEGLVEPLTSTVAYRTTTSFTVVGSFVISDDAESIVVSSTVP